MASYNPQPFVSNPYSSFDQSQYTDPYSLFSGKALPWPSQFAGTPVDAYGNPIQSYTTANSAAQALYQQQLAAYNAATVAAQQQPAAQPAASGTSGTSGMPGTTLNSSPGSQTPSNTMPVGAASGLLSGNTVSPGAQAAIANNPQYAQLAGWQALSSPQMAAKGDTFGDPYINMITAAMNPQTSAAAPAAATATPPTPPDMSQAYLQALANPGPLKPVGANVPASATTTQPGPGVLQQFLANWQPQGGTGPGAGFTQSFSKALRGA